MVSRNLDEGVRALIQGQALGPLQPNTVMMGWSSDEKRSLEYVKHLHSVTLLSGSVVLMNDKGLPGKIDKKRIDIWLTPGDYSNANLMILLSYILMGHPEWKGCRIELFAAFEASKMDHHVVQLNQLIDDGRIPIAKKNLQKIPWDKDKSSYEAMVTQYSESADLVIMGFSLKKIKKEKGDFFKKFGNVKDILFVRAGQKILITEESE